MLSGGTFCILAFLTAAVRTGGLSTTGGRSIYRTSHTQVLRAATAGAVTGFSSILTASTSWSTSTPDYERRH